MRMGKMGAEAVLKFWFVEHGPEDWYKGEAAFDRLCAERLAGVHAQAARAELWEWRRTAEGRVAELILLDQISRQIYRGDPRAFACDTMAIALAQELVAAGLDRELEKDFRLFAYMPYQHAESLAVQEESVRLFTGLGDEEILQYAVAHKETIARFGRFPFRNKALGRQSTAEELAYIGAREGEVF